MSKPHQISLLRFVCWTTGAGMVLGLVGMVGLNAEHCSREESLRRSMPVAIAWTDENLITGRIDYIGMSATATKADFEKLHLFAHLQYLTCESPSFDDQCLMELTNCRSLIDVDLRESKVTEQGIAGFQQEMRRQHRTVILRNNSME